MNIEPLKRCFVGAQFRFRLDMRDLGKPEFDAEIEIDYIMQVPGSETFFSAIHSACAAALANMWPARTGIPSAVTLRKISRLLFRSHLRGYFNW